MAAAAFTVADQLVNDDYLASLNQRSWRDVQEAGPEEPELPPPPTTSLQVGDTCLAGLHEPPGGPPQPLGRNPDDPMLSRLTTRSRAWTA